jgi:aryl-alcohol dehydrogenase-like predicted oxidoreductase
MWWRAAKDETRNLYNPFREAIGNFIDTANLYTNGTSESFLGEFMKGQRESVVMATKYTNAASVTRNFHSRRVANLGGGHTECSSRSRKCPVELIPFAEPK